MRAVVTGASSGIWGFTAFYAALDLFGKPEEVHGRTLSLPTGADGSGGSGGLSVPRWAGLFQDRARAGLELEIIRGPGTIAGIDFQADGHPDCL